MLCNKCGGVLSVIRIEKVPKDKKYIDYERLCDVECLKCNKVFYSQPYDNGKRINMVRKITRKDT
ncbi:hypothetical protein SAMN05216225_101136 [Ornithinibacillus halophilus]|uniref:Uncharacterized protein n=1 Tax=Ornithinibacillus halophilus TaxID=930117 RepID=A0A1M5G256_9BACI|nr:hypothetical protein SAMN05216225_101136 [Ornithinibacillus halophilus]